ncbi:MAG: hypothetical protein H0W33_05565 [Gammaproteobacteria bacterium]|nr:hypothetical protein [Gammaproteobacteria bacterium]
MSFADFLSGDRAQRSEPSIEEERLLKLYWNRADLKREYSDLRRERDFLLEKLKEKDGEIVRAHDQLEALESLLTNPASALNAVVHFQLRALWRRCHQKLAQLAIELRNQQEERERRRQTREFNQEKQKRLRALDAQTQERQANVDLARSDCVNLAETRAGFKAFWHYFKRRSVERRLAEMTGTYEAERTELKRLREQREKVESEPWPEFPGLGLDSKRTINIAVIALAQRLFIHFALESLALMAKAAMLKPVQAMGYGSVEECNRLIERIGQALAATTTDREYARELRQRSAHLMALAKYRKETDMVPVASSIGSIRAGYEGESLAGKLDADTLEVNVLAEDYWDVYRALLG